jgi:ubiquinol-cytochrome c reductase subunit 9
MGVRFTSLFRALLLSTCPHSSPLLFTTRSPSEIVSVLRNSTLGFAHSRVRFAGVFVTTIFAGAFAFGVGFDVGVTNLWDSWNRGVRCHLPSFILRRNSHIHQKQWKDIRPRYIQEGGDSE